MDSSDRYTVADLSLSEAGRLKVEWARSRMPALASLKAKAEIERPLEGQRIAGCLHVTKETAVLIETLESAGAEISWSGCNPLSTQDEVAAWLASEGYSIHAWYGQDNSGFYECIDRTLEFDPTLTLDDGADLIYRVHSQFKDLAQGIIGGTEETTTGVHRLRAMADAGELLYPVIAVNDAETKWDFDNVHGTGQSTIDGILRATSVLLAGKNFVIAGYGHCGKGLAMRARGMGANVIITEIDPIPALKATMDGFRVMKMDEAASIGDLFCTATGMKDVIVGRHYDSMKDGAIVCNTGHYDCEVSISDLEERATEIFTIRDNNEAFSMPDGRRIHLLARGRLVNLASAEGHPSEVMDMSFANQFLALCRLAREGSTYDNSVYDIHPDQDRQLAALKLSSSGIVIDELTEDQKAYLHDFSVGT
ncbi:MAG TPA: adenosylhomocysteinase [Candidatus Thalassarchaeaceae archaeon]|nr:adenosylhomocysteinase [Euryarchaeota archaeon]DAC43087.1 MAG TPA: adenosylhomocysteinase [Candidatus Poseidoniales archaeon]HII35197.1 adenosylhomocysteinase [Candidatus Thalassarchaeaceae archaeon]|tara:strand:- start:1298 stop:2563 length:1266 start_codon:yes stop_codon:yes gene_type:complete